MDEGNYQTQEYENGNDSPGNVDKEEKNG